MSTLTATWPLFACNLGMFLGRTVVGILADKIGAVQMLVMALEVAGVLQIVAWHYATSFGGVMAFAVTYGLLGGSALSLLCKIAFNQSLSAMLTARSCSHRDSTDLGRSREPRHGCRVSHVCDRSR